MEERADLRNLIRESRWSELREAARLWPAPRDLRLSCTRRRGSLRLPVEGEATWRREADALLPVAGRPRARRQVRYRGCAAPIRNLDRTAAPPFFRLLSDRFVIR